MGSSLSGTLSGSAKSVPSHRDRKSFHPAFAAVPPPKPGGFNKPVPPVRPPTLFMFIIYYLPKYKYVIILFYLRVENCHLFLTNQFAWS